MAAIDRPIMSIRKTQRTWRYIGNFGIWYGSFIYPRWVQTRIVFGSGDCYNDWWGELNECLEARNWPIPPKWINDIYGENENTIPNTFCDIAPRRKQTPEPSSAVFTRASNECSRIFHEVKAFSWLKSPTSAFTFKVIRTSRLVSIVSYSCPSLMTFVSASSVPLSLLLTMRSMSI